MIPRITETLRLIRTGPPPPEPPVVCKPVSFWKKVFGKYLLLTNTLSSGGLMLIGDVVSQEIEFRKGLIPERYDYMRLFYMTLVGLSQGPMHHYIYKYLDLIIKKSDFKSVIKKVLIDQIVLSPVFIVSYFYSAGLLEGAKIPEVTKELRQKYWTIYSVDWCVWPPAQFLNFYFIKPEYRVVYINIITMFYNVFLCFSKHTEMDH